ncbi:MAG: hypothetical protein LBV10_19530 [Stenotrophomonas sp.]|uniref:hypothetical protein n=1 Tax=Stenotrophomonas sp. TaxID=69392 RepID=UPI00283ED834|nr:hypothetical protein [Stenotrophomonas sp.]MDR2961718.1 hypothetical protein [Stenotrophomonas sp.]
MTTPHTPAPHPIHDAPANGPAPDPNTLIALLHSIGAGAACDGQPWPVRHQLPGRRVALADTDCSLAGLRVVMERMSAGVPEPVLMDRALQWLAGNVPGDARCDGEL